MTQSRSMLNVLSTKVIHLSLVKILLVASVLQIVSLLVYTILLYWYQSGQVIILIIYCCVVRKDKADNNIGSTLEKATFSVIQENKTNQFILCIGNDKGGSASLLFITCS